MNSTLDEQWMRRALELAARGRGSVEPNPLVGCVVVQNDQIVGEGFHQRFGGPHAEVFALQEAGVAAREATLYVTLEPCCHYGKTPPCTEAVLAAGVHRVVVAMRDPFPAVDGGGLRQIQSAGIEIQTGVLEAQARELNAPYLKLISKTRPWVIAKWAMTLDGKIATRTGDSRWISSPESREIVHRLRGQVDAILVGHGTVKADDPLLTARPTRSRTATRIVLDSNLAIGLDSQLVRTAKETPTLIVAAAMASREKCNALRACGCEVLMFEEHANSDRLGQLLDELGRRKMTNLLVEGGARVLGSFLDARLIDAVHVFIAPKIIGDGDAKSAVSGVGVTEIADSLTVQNGRIQSVGGDIYFVGRMDAT